MQNFQTAGTDESEPISSSVLEPNSLLHRRAQIQRERKRAATN